MKCPMCGERRDASCSAYGCPAPDTSYDEVPQEQIRRMNEHAKSAFAKGNWVTETSGPEFCERCIGKGWLLCERAYHGDRSDFWKETCPECHGTGKNAR